MSNESKTVFPNKEVITDTIAVDDMGFYVGDCEVIFNVPETELYDNCSKGEYTPSKKGISLRYIVDFYKQAHNL